MKKLLATHACFLALTILPQTAIAGCDNPQTTLEMRSCAGAEYETADAALNITYQQVRKSMKALDQDLPEAAKGAARSLLEAQRAWIKFRDASCETEGFLFRGGTMEPVMVLYCKGELTRQRTRQLEYLLEGS